MFSWQIAQSQLIDFLSFSNDDNTFFIREKDNEKGLKIDQTIFILF